MRIYKYICKKCRARFDALEGFLEHNKECESFGYEKELVVKKTYAPNATKDKKLKKEKKTAIDSTPKPAEANEQELASNAKEAKKLSKTLGRPKKKD